MTIRQHWIRIVRTPSIVAAWGAMFLFGSSWLDGAFERNRFALLFDPLLLLVIFIFFATIVYQWLRWRYCYIRIDHQNISWRDGLNEYCIPRWTIRNAFVLRPFLLGPLFDYGTIIIDTGIFRQSLSFVPNIGSISQALFSSTEYLS